MLEGKKIRTLSLIIYIVGSVCSVILGIYLLNNSLYLGLGSLLLGCLVNMAIYAIMDGCGTLLQKVSMIADENLYKTNQLLYDILDKLKVLAGDKMQDSSNALKDIDEDKNAVVEEGINKK